MSKASTDTRGLAAAERGQIIQRVLVDGWTPAQAGAPFGVDERLVAAWVAAYRRHGMATLRDEVPVEHAPRRWLGRLFARFSGRLHGGIGSAPARCIVLRRADDDREPSSPTRHSIWN